MRSSRNAIFYYGILPLLVHHYYDWLIIHNQFIHLYLEVSQNLNSAILSHPRGISHFDFSVSFLYVCQPLYYGIPRIPFLMPSCTLLLCADIFQPHFVQPLVGLHDISHFFCLLVLHTTLDTRHTNAQLLSFHLTYRVLDLG